jgi:hypothetical protein
MITHLLVLRGHGAPPSRSLITDSSFGSFSSEVVGNDRAGRLHVEEERSQRTFWCIRVMLSLLALLLSAGSGISGGMKLARGTDATIQFSKLEERVLAELGKGRFNIEACAVLSEDRVGVLDVSARECLDGILESRETGDDLFPH